jgi:hypothetical protein
MTTNRCASFSTAADGGKMFGKIEPDLFRKLPKAELHCHLGINNIGKKRGKISVFTFEIYSSYRHHLPNRW